MRSGQVPSRATPITLTIRHDLPWLLRAARGDLAPAEPGPGWTSDVQFLRAANEDIGLSVLVALSDRRSRAGRWALLLAAAMACGVALEYAVRQ